MNLKWKKGRWNVCPCPLPDYWPYGWEYLKPYENWDMSTITAMVNGKYADMIKRNVETILEEISRTELRLP